MGNPGSTAVYPRLLPLICLLSASVRSMFYCYDLTALQFSQTGQNFLRIYLKKVVTLLLFFFFNCENYDYKIEGKCLELEEDKEMDRNLRILMFSSFIFLFIYGCVGSSSLCEGFL